MQTKRNLTAWVFACHLEEDFSNARSEILVHSHVDADGELGDVEAEGEDLRVEGEGADRSEDEGQHQEPVAREDSTQR